MRASVLDGVEVGRHDTARARAAQEQDDDEEDGSNDGDAAGGRAVGAELGPLAAGGAGVLLEVVTAELVVDEPGQGNAVTEGLQAADRVAEDEHRGDDEQDVLEHARESHDERGSLANLCGQG